MVACGHLEGDKHLKVRGPEGRVPESLQPKGNRRL